jgi:hypothetical protein
VLEQLAFFLAMRAKVVKQALEIHAYLSESTGIVPRYMIQSHYDSFQLGTQSCAFVPQRLYFAGQMWTGVCDQVHVTTVIAKNLYARQVALKGPSVKTQGRELVAVSAAPRHPLQRDSE